jgi:hypothetical protein
MHNDLMIFNQYCYITFSLFFFLQDWHVPRFPSNDLFLENRKKETSFPYFYSSCSTRNVSETFMIVEVHSKKKRRHEQMKLTTHLKAHHVLEMRFCRKSDRDKTEE